MTASAGSSHTTARGRVVRGYRAASGLCRNRSIPLGTIRPQLRFFRSIPGFGHRFRRRVHPGTINIRFDRRLVSPGVPRHRIDAVRWTRLIPAENFFITPCTLIHRQRHHPGYLYVPDPETKPGGPPRDGIVEVLCGRIAGITYGAPVRLRFPTKALRLDARPPRWLPIMKKDAL